MHIKPCNFVKKSRHRAAGHSRCGTPDFPATVLSDSAVSGFANCVRTLAMLLVPASPAAQTGNRLVRPGTAEGRRTGTETHQTGLVRGG